MSQVLKHYTALSALNQLTSIFISMEKEAMFTQTVLFVKKHYYKWGLTNNHFFFS